MRPLLYTEAPREAPLPIAGLEEWQNPRADPVAYPSDFATTAVTEAPAAHGAAARTPEALVLDVYAALVANDRDRLLAHLFDAPTFAAVTGVSLDEARGEVEALTEQTLGLLGQFSGGSPTDQRPGGIGAQLSPGQLQIGSARSRDGAAAASAAEAEMVWGSRLTFSLRSEQGVEFELRFPNMVVDASGVWRLRAVPTASSNFAVFRAAGLDLTPALLEPEHAPIPMRVGNFWHYVTRRPGLEVAVNVRGAPREGYRDAVVDLVDHGRYRVASLRRVYDDPGLSPERLGYLLTPRRIYACGTECQRRASSLPWALSFMEAQTPVLALPLVRGEGWGAGGFSRRENIHRVQLDLAEVDTPAGRFSEAVEITRSTPQGRQSTFFVHGVGFVMVRADSALQPRVDALLSYRILP